MCVRSAVNAQLSPAEPDRLRLKECDDRTVSTAPIELDQPDIADADPLEAAERPWTTIVWNDPVNLMSYVSYVFQTYFGYPRTKAEKLMMDVHQRGKAAVSNGSREEMERDVAAMHGYGLWATLQHD
jgi:ATP-dependent Clp protease adaptor protein ClpS